VKGLSWRRAYGFGNRSTYVADWDSLKMMLKAATNHLCGGRYKTGGAGRCENIVVTDDFASPDRAIGCDWIYAISVFLLSKSPEHVG
jgi:hypothetical protein